MNPYKILGVRRNASAKTIKAAYRRKAKSAHPDTGGSTEAFETLRMAYDVLRDPDARAHYDATGQVKRGEADNQVAQALALLSQAIDAVLQQNANFTEVDLVELIRQHVEDGIAQRADQRGKIDATRPRWEEMRERFTGPDDEPNMMAQIIAGKIAALDRSRQQMDAADTIARRALDVLDGHSYRFDPRSSVVMSFSSNVIGSSTTAW